MLGRQKPEPHYKRHGINFRQPYTLTKKVRPGFESGTFAI